LRTRDLGSYCILTRIPVHNYGTQGRWIPFAGPFPASCVRDPTANWTDEPNHD